MTERWYEEGQLVATEWETLALAFVKTLMKRDFRAAREMLSQELRSKLTEESLEQRTLKLISEECVAMCEPWVLSSLDSWPDKRAAELGQAYVCVGGDLNEAITPTVVTENGKLFIGDISWYRP